MTTTEEFLRQLDYISQDNGVPYGRLRLLFEDENKHHQATLKYIGFVKLSDAFKCFFFETIELFNTVCAPQAKEPAPWTYAVFLPRLTHSFRTLCGAERLANLGYPFQAYTLLRNTVDDSILTSAALQKVTDFNSIEGFKQSNESKEFNIATIKKLRKQTEYKVRQIMTGKDSGLSKETQDEIAQWDELFDYEVHGARLSLARAMSWMKGEQPLPVFPQFDEKQFPFFMNRYCEVGWMIHRLTPAIQLPNTHLTEVWMSKWRILDNSFERIANSLTKELNMPIGAAIVELVKTKFPFDEKSAFPL